MSSVDKNQDDGQELSSPVSMRINSDTMRFLEQQRKIWEKKLGSTLTKSSWLSGLLRVYHFFGESPAESLHPRLLRDKVNAAALWTLYNALSDFDVQDVELSLRMNPECIPLVKAFSKKFSDVATKVEREMETK